MIDNIAILKEEITLLDERKEGLNYRLYMITSASGKRYYAVEAEGMGDSELALLGSDIQKAQKTYERIARGGVSPVTLDDVARDAVLSEKY